MIPSHLRTLFWDVDADTFVAREFPEYAISRVLEMGDEAAVAWLRETFTEDEIRRVLSTERRLSEKSANFWALVYDVPRRDVAALSSGR